MGFDLTIMSKKIEGIKQAFENGRFADALVGSLTTGSGKMKQRIFTATVDVKGQSFGKYVGVKKKSTDRALVRSLFGTTSKTDKKRIKAAAPLELTAYQRKRANAGRQILRKDLDFRSDLRKSIEVHVEGERAAVLEFNNDKAAKIAHGQEQQIANIRAGGKGTTKGSGATKIVAFNNSEKEEVVEQGLELIKQILIPKS